MVLLLPGQAVQAQLGSPTAPSGALIAEDAVAQPVALDEGLPSLVLNVAGQYGGEFSAVAVSQNGAAVFVGTRYGFAVVDPSLSPNPRQIGRTRMLEAEVFDLEVDGGTLYAAVRQRGLYVYDVTDPQNPVEVGWYAHAGRMAVKDDRVFLAADGALRVLNANQPGLLQEIGRLALPSASGIALSGDYVYVTALSNLHIIDVRNPFHPVEVGSVAVQGAANVTAANGYVYVSIIYDGFTEDGFVVVDVTNPAAPVVGTRVTLPGYTYDVLATSHGLLVAGSYAMRTFDISDPRQPVMAGMYPLRYYGVGLAVHGDSAYVGAWREGLHRIAIRDLFTMSEVGYSATPRAVRGVHVSGDYVYAAAGEAGLRILNVANPMQPQEVGFFDSPGDAQNVVVVGTRAYLADGRNYSPGSGISSVRILDVSDAAHPVELGFYQTPDAAMDVHVSGSLMYVAALEAGLHIADVSDPNHPQRVGWIDTPGEAVDVVVVTKAGRTYALVADTMFGIRIVDVTNPAHPQEVSHFPQNFGGRWQSVEVRGDYAYLTNSLTDASSDGLYIIDIHNLLAPRFVSLAPARRARGIQISGNRAYVGGDRTSYSEGVVTVFDLTDPLHPIALGAYDSSGLIAERNGLVFQGHQSGVRVIDARHLGVPVGEGMLVNGPAVDVAKVGDYGLLTGDSSLRVVDLADPARLSVASSVATTTPTVQVAISGDYAYVTQRSVLDRDLNRSTGGGLAVFDVSNPLTPTQIGFFAAPSGYGLGPVAVSGRYVYTVDCYCLDDDWDFHPMDMLYIIDTINPAAPVQVGSYRASTWIVDMKEHGEYVVLTVDGQLLILSVANPAQPVVVGALELTDGNSYAEALAVAGDFAYVGNDAASGPWRELLQVIDISNPADPVLVSSLSGRDRIYALTVADDRLYASPIRVYDLSRDQAAPQEIGSLSVQIAGEPVSVAADSGIIYMPNRSGGLVSIRTAAVAQSLRFPFVLKSR